MEGPVLGIAMKRVKALQMPGCKVREIFSQLIRAGNDRRSLMFFWSHQEFRVAQGKADATKSGTPRLQDRQDETEDSRRHPTNEGWGDQKPGDEG